MEIMGIGFRAAIAPFRALIISGIIGVIIIMCSYFYFKEDNDVRPPPIQELTINDMALLCRYERCNYLKVNNLIYLPNKDYTKITLVDSVPRESITLYEELLLSSKHIGDTTITLYTLDWDLVTDIVTLLVLLLMVTIVLGIGYFLERKFITTNEDKMAMFKDENSLENNLRMLIAATAHHEMLTPIAVIKASVNKLTHSKYLKDNIEYIEVFNILNTTVTRMESVLNQMSSVRELYKKPKSKIYNIIRTTLESLQVIFTEYNFTYNISDKELLNTITNYKLESGTISNLLNNLFKNSLEAGASVISITPILDGNNLILTIIDNGSGVPRNKDGMLPDIFKLGYSNKHGTEDIIRINKELSSNTCRGNGLYLVRTILHNVDGDIELIRTESNGSVFRITLPIKQVN